MAFLEHKQIDGDPDIFHGGHGNRYYNRYFSYVQRVGAANNVKEAYKNLGFQDVSNKSKVQRMFRIYDTASEIWANVNAAETCGGKSLDYVKKYLPNIYKTYLELMEKNLP